MQQTLSLQAPAKQTEAPKGLSGFTLKYLAAVFMVLDHVHYFFGFIGKIPLLFSKLGRLAAPLFLFCVIEGFTHTHDRKKYFLRIYLLSVIMGAIQFSFYNIGSALVRPDGFFPQNQMLASFSILLVVLQGFDWCAQKKRGRGQDSPHNRPLLVGYTIPKRELNTKCTVTHIRIVSIRF